MDFWDALGIAPSQNVTFIKKAYRMQMTAIEANQGGFAEKAKLEAAFQQALNHADPGRFTKTETPKQQPTGGSVATLRNLAEQLTAPQMPKKQASTKPPRQQRRNENAQQHHISTRTAKPRKKTTAPQPAAPAMPTKNRQRVRQGNEHKQNSTVKKLLRFLGILLLLITLGATVFRSRLEYFWYTSPLANQFRETVDLGGKDYEDLSNLKEGSGVEEFMYYFYGQPMDDDKEDFIRGNMTGEAAQQAQQYLDKRPSDFVVKKAYDFDWEMDKVADGRQIHLISREEAPLLLVEMNEDDQIAAVYGEGWTVLPEAEFNDLHMDVQVTPYHSASHFGSYLIAEDTAAFMERYGMYFSANAKTRLAQSKIDFRESFAEGGFFRCAYKDGQTIGGIFYDNQRKPQFLVTFTPRGEIGQIISPAGNWDTYSKKDWEAVTKMLADSEFGLYELRMD